MYIPKRFEVGCVYVHHDWFTGGEQRYRYEGLDKAGKGIFTVRSYEADGVHDSLEKHKILRRDNGDEYILFYEYKGHANILTAE